MTNNDLKLERRKRFLESLIKEAVINVLAEQQPPVPEAPSAPPAPPQAAPETTSQETPAQSSPEQVNQEFTVDDMIERLNVVRGGRSFTDPEVYGQLVTWFKKLNEDQKSVLQNFLMDLGKIVINVPEQDKQEPAQSVQSQNTPPAPPPPPPAPAVAPEAPAGSAPTPGL